MPYSVLFLRKLDNQFTIQALMYPAETAWLVQYKIATVGTIFIADWLSEGLKRKYLEKCSVLAIRYLEPILAM